VLGVIVVNTAIGLIQEGKAERVGAVLWRVVLCCCVGLAFKRGQDAVTKQSRAQHTACRVRGRRLFTDANAVPPACARVLSAVCVLQAAEAIKSMLSANAMVGWVELGLMA
jgi:hypothetical protein